jgi:uncharacterized membrane protein
MGDVASSRSPRELKENAIRSGGFFTGFFVMIPLLMSLLNKGRVTISGVLERGIEKGHSTATLEKEALWAAKTYLGSYLLDIVFVAAIVKWTNDLTVKAVKQDVQALKTSSAPSNVTPLKA